MIMLTITGQSHKLSVCWQNLAPGLVPRILAGASAPTGERFFCAHLFYGGLYEALSSGRVL